MPALTIPEIFYKGWFWFGIAIPIAVIVYLVRKKSPASFSKTDNFFIRHKVTIRKALDVLLICMIIFWLSFSLYFARSFAGILSCPKPIQAETQQLSMQFLLIFLIEGFGRSGFFLGLISVFQSNLTKTKRIILLFACLLPVIFTAFLLLTDKILGYGSIIRLCLYSSFLSWIVNAPAIILNKSFSQFAKGIEKKLKSLFGQLSQ